MRKVALIAGTPVDTKMGLEFIEKKNSEAGERIFDPIYLPAEEGCDEQALFQRGSEDRKRKRVDELFDIARSDGACDFFIYCNSLAGAFDFESYAAEKTAETENEIKVYTPHQVYRDLGRSYSCLGVVAAHNMSASAIEIALMEGNPDICVIGSGNLQIVRMIEEGIEAEEIARSCGLKSMAEYMKASGAEAILLGCTHFPYLTEALKALTDLPIIDPAEEMYKNLLQG